jgi:hypothetical protein
MQYNTIITPAVQFGTDLEIPIGTLGDSVHIKLSPRFDTALYFDEVETSIPKTPKKHVRLNYFKKGIVDALVEGGTFGIEAILSEPDVVDTVVDFVITHDITNLDKNVRKSRFASSTFTQDINLFIKPSVDADFDIVLGQITILAGQTRGSATITTVDDTLLTGGKGFYKACQVELVGVDNGYMVHHTLSNGYVLIEDSSEYPVWTGAEFELWGKNIDKSTGLLDPEPIVKDDVTVVLELGYTTEDDGVTPKDSLARTFIVDYTPLDKIYIRCKTDSVITALDGTDISTLPPFYCAVVIVGENR